MVKQIVIEYTGPGHSPKVSLLHFTDDTDQVLIAQSIDDLMEGWRAWASNAYEARVNPEVVSYDTATGAITGSSPFLEDVGPWAGTVDVTPMADATQALLRWRTPVIAGGRFVRGRTFLPGIANNYVLSGNPAAAMVAGLTTTAQEYANSNGGPVVWSRRHGVAAQISSGSCWNEFAVLRGRRG